MTNDDRLTDRAFDAEPHVDDCDCGVGHPDPRCLAYREQLEELWSSNAGMIVCRKHGGISFAAYLETHPRASRFTTSLDAWEKMTDVDKRYFEVLTGSPMRCEVCAQAERTVS